MSVSYHKSAWQWLWSGCFGQASTLPCLLWTTATTCWPSMSVATGGSRSRRPRLAGQIGHASALAGAKRSARRMTLATLMRSFSSIRGRTLSCAYQWRKRTAGSGFHGGPLTSGQTWASFGKSKHSAVDFLVSVSAQEMKTVEPKQTALDGIGRLSGDGTKSGQRAGTRSCNNATSRWFAEDRAK